MKIKVRVQASNDPRCEVGTVGRATLFASYNGVRSDSVQSSSRMRARTRTTSITAPRSTTRFRRCSRDPARYSRACEREARLASCGSLLSLEVSAPSSKVSARAATSDTLDAAVGAESPRTRLSPPRPHAEILLHRTSSCATRARSVVCVALQAWQAAASKLVHAAHRQDDRRLLAAIAKYLRWRASARSAHRLTRILAGRPSLPDHRAKQSARIARGAANHRCCGRRAEP
jgi:hypothetical protein